MSCQRNDGIHNDVLYHTKHIVLLLTSNNKIIHNSCVKTSTIAYSSEHTGALRPLIEIMTNVLAELQVIGAEDIMFFCCCHPLVTEAELSVPALAIGD